MDVTILILAIFGIGLLAITYAFFAGCSFVLHGIKVLIARIFTKQ